MRNFRNFVVILGSAALLFAGDNSIFGPTSALAAERSHDGLLALYDFDDPEGPVVKDRSGVGEAVDLRIVDLKKVRRAAGELELRGKTLIRSEKPATKIIDAIGKSNEISIEVWLRPAKTDQTGPARLITLSKDTTNRNFTLGQDGDKYDARLRTTKTSTNGIPSLPTPGKAVTTVLTHLVFARNRDGQARVYINGKQSAVANIGGDMQNWDKSYRLAIGNELTGDRAWAGTLYFVAIYDRGLSVADVARNFQAGPNSEKLQEQLAAAKLVRNAKRFNQHIAPLLVNHCFECHDASTHKGDLDLSRKTAAFAGGESGAAIVPGNAKKSLLWESIESGDMPKDRESLSDDEMKQLRLWIDDGATWTVDTIDPAIYGGGARTPDIFVQRLTVTEYIATVRSVTGVDIEADARKILPPDVRADGFSNTAYNLGVDLGHVQAYAELAAIIVERMDVDKLLAFVSKQQDLDDDNLRLLIKNMGQWFLRGPLDDREIAAYQRTAAAVVAQKGTFAEVTRYLAEAMLQSPRFIYRIEQQRGDGTRQPVEAYELASRMSYILWGAPPDLALYRAAGAGDLADRAEVAEQVQRMLKDPRAIARSSQFLSQWLHLDRLNNLRPNEKRYPNWQPALADDMRAETLAFFEEIAWRQNRPLSELFNAQVTFASPRLAKHYGLVRRPSKATNGLGSPSYKGLTRFDLSEVPARGGLLTQGSVLTIGGDESSMVARGLFVLHNVLRGEVKDPPPCVDTTPVPTKEGLTQRGIALDRIANNACGGCHSKFEPLAFGLERFDGLGVYQEHDKHQNLLREDGEILFPGEAEAVNYKSAAELMTLLANSDRAAQTLTWKVTQFALGRRLTATDAPLVDKIHTDALTAGGTYADLITAIVMSDLVQKTRTEADQ